MQDNILWTLTWMIQLLIQETKNRNLWWVQGQSNTTHRWHKSRCEQLHKLFRNNWKLTQCLNDLLKETLTTGSLTDCGSSFLFLERAQLHWWTNEGKMEGKKRLFVLPGNGSGSGKKTVWVVGWYKVLALTDQKWLHWLCFNRPKGSLPHCRKGQKRGPKCWFCPFLDKQEAYSLKKELHNQVSL